MLKKIWFFSWLLLLCTSCAPALDLPEEALPGGSVSILSKQDYIGKWHQSPMVPSGYARRYAFYEDGAYVYHESDMDGENRLRFTSGVWDIEGDTLVLYVDKKVVLEGGAAVAAYASYGSETVIEGGTYNFITLEEPEIMRLSLSPVTANKTPDEPAFITSIGNETYWQWAQEQTDMFLSFEQLQQQQLEHQYAAAYILFNSNRVPLSVYSLKNLDYFTLHLAKNEIFARHGYVFKNPVLAEYFSNMPWYRPDESFSGAYEDLSEIEQKNVDLIQKAYDGYYDGTPIDIQEHWENNNGQYILEVIEDLDGDGYDETIRMVLSRDASQNIYYGVESLSVKSGVDGVTHDLDTAWMITPHFNIFLANFNVDDPLLQFYIKDDGPSNDLTTMVYTFQDGEFQENLLTGHITQYDGKGKIYTEYNHFLDHDNTCHSYYDLDKGLVPAKENIIGKNISFPMDLLLFDQQQTAAENIQAYIIGDSFIEYMQQFYPETVQQHVVEITQKNTPLEIAGVVFESYEGGYLPEPLLQLKTPNQKTGWVHLIRGD